jgi:hypothetical protein
MMQLTVKVEVGEPHGRAIADSIGDHSATEHGLDEPLALPAAPDEKDIIRTGSALQLEDHRKRRGGKPRQRLRPLPEDIAIGHRKTGIAHQVVLTDFVIVVPARSHVWKALDLKLPLKKRYQCLSFLVIGVVVPISEYEQICLRHSVPKRRVAEFDSDEPDIVEQQNLFVPG